MIKSTIFDFDDTLVETHKAKWAHHKEVAKKFYGIDLEDETIREHWGKPFDVLITRLYEESDTIDNMRAANRSCAADFPKTLCQHSLEVIDTLLNNNVSICILTSTNREYLDKDLETLGFPVKNFLHLQGADETQVHKPDPRVFKPTIDRLSAFGIEKNECVYVGDALVDFFAARDAGVSFVGITSGLHTEKEFVQFGARNVLDDINQLPSLMLQSYKYVNTQNS